MGKIMAEWLAGHDELSHLHPTCGGDDICRVERLAEAGYRLAEALEEARDYACGCDGYDGPCQYHRSEASKVVDRALKAWNRLALP